jgi:hypothetical protein
MLVEGIITLLIVSALFYVAPGVLWSVSGAAPFVPQNWTGCTVLDMAHNLCAANPLNASAVSIGTTTAGALNLSSIGLIMMGIGILIAGFMIIRGYK